MNPLVRFLQEQLEAERKALDRLLDEPDLPLTNYVLGHVAGYTKALAFYRSLHPDPSRTETPS